MRPLYDSKIVTFSEESELHIKLPRTSLKNPYTPFEETVAQILQVEYNVVLKEVRKKSQRIYEGARKLHNVTHILLSR
jgi:hypothetical protein